MRAAHCVHESDPSQRHADKYFIVCGLHADAPYRHVSEVREKVCDRDEGRECIAKNLCIGFGGGADP